MFLSIDSPELLPLSLLPVHRGLGKHFLAVKVSKEILTVGLSREIKVYLLREDQPRIDLRSLC